MMHRKIPTRTPASDDLETEKKKRETWEYKYIHELIHFKIQDTPCNLFTKLLNKTRNLRSTSILLYLSAEMN